MIRKIGTDLLNGQERDIYLLTGTATKDGAVRTFDSGKVKGTVSIAAGKRKDSTTIFVDIGVWGGRAGLAARFKKGEAVLAIGPVSEREYNERTYLECSADFITGESLSPLARNNAPAAFRSGDPVNVSAADFDVLDEDDGELPF